MTRSLITALAASLCLIVPSIAEAKDPLDYRGSSSQSRLVKLRADDGGAPKSVAFYWRARCGDGVLDTASAFRFEPGPAIAAIQLRGGYTTPVGNGLKARIRTVGGGRLARAHDRWSGRFPAKAVIFDHGERRTRCQTPKLRWAVKLVAGDYERSGQIVFDSQDENEFFMQGQDYTSDFTSVSPPQIRPRNDRLTIKASLGSVVIGVEDGLRPGTYTVDRTREPAPPPDATMDIEWLGRDCKPHHGAFTITQYAFTRRVYDVEYTLEFYCAGGSALLVAASFHHTPPPFTTLKSDPPTAIASGVARDRSH